VLEGAGIFQDVIQYTSTDLRSLAGILRLLRNIRNHRADVLIYLASDRNCLFRIWRDRMFFRAAGVRRFEYTASSKVRAWGTFRRTDRIYPHEVDRLMVPISKLVGYVNHFDFNLPIRSDHERKAHSIFERFASPAPRVVALCPGAKISSKQWPADNYAALGERLIREAGVNIAVIGAEKERRVGESIAL